jgi:hypothetical protein
MMFQVIFLKGNSTGKNQGEIGRQGGNFIEKAFFEDQVMRGFMDADIQRMAGEGAGKVGYSEDEPPGSVAEEIRQNDLNPNAKQDHAESPGIPADQGPDFRMFMDNFFCPGLMWLTFRTPPEAVRLGHVFFLIEGANLLLFF